MAELALLDGEVHADVLLEAGEDGRWRRVAAGAEAPPDAERLRGLVIPGLANAHSHAFHRALRGTTHAGAGDFWTWREQMYAVAGRLDPDRYAALARAVYAEMALAGITAVGEFHYVHHQPDGTPYDEPDVMTKALVEAAAEAGIRLTLLDTCYLRGGFDQPLDGVQRRFGDGTVEAWADRASRLSATPTVQPAAAVHSVRAVAEQDLGAVAAWARERDAPLHVHVSEQPAENSACVAATGRTPVALLADHGVLGPRTTAVHATHLTRADVALLGDTATVVCLCPTTERDLADGVGPARTLADAGSPLCLGSDSHAVIDLFEDARAVELDERLITGERGRLDAGALLTAATHAGQRALGWDVGLRPGALADACAVALDSVRTAGATPATAVAHTVFAATAADVHAVIVGGRTIVRDGDHARVADVPAALARALAALA